MLISFKTVARATHEYTVLMQENKLGIGSMLLPVAQVISE